MRTGNRRLCAFLASICIGGCSAMPKLEASYYHARLDAEFTLLETAACTPGNVPVATFEVLPREVYSRDVARTKETINFSWFGNSVSKGDVAIEYFPDGRLKSLGITQTGQGAAAIQALLKLARTPGLAAEPSIEFQAACAALRGLAGEGKTLTIKYFGSTPFNTSFPKDETKSVVTAIELKRLTLSDDQFESVSEIFGPVVVTFEAKKVDSLTHIVKSDSPHLLGLIQPAETDVKFKVALAGKKLEWVQTFRVPQLGDRYELPLPKTLWFGENKFTVALHDSGAIQKLQYAGGGDAAGVVTTLGEVRSSLDETATEKLAQLKLESDLIAEQQRWARCRATPETCE